MFWRRFSPRVPQHFCRRASRFGSWRQPIRCKWQSGCSAPLLAKCPRISTLTSRTPSLGWHTWQEACWKSSIGQRRACLFCPRPVRPGVQEDPEWVTQYCFTIGTLWCWRNQEMLKVRLLAEPFLGAEVWWNQCRKGWQMSGRSPGAASSAVNSVPAVHLG